MFADDLLSEVAEGRAALVLPRLSTEGRSTTRQKTRAKKRREPEPDDLDLPETTSGTALLAALPKVQKKRKRDVASSDAVSQEPEVQEAEIEGVQESEGADETEVDRDSTLAGYDPDKIRGQRLVTLDTDEEGRRPEGGSSSHAPSQEFMPELETSLPGSERVPMLGLNPILGTKEVKRLMSLEGLNHAPLRLPNGFKVERGMRVTPENDLAVVLLNSFLHAPDVEVAAGMATAQRLSQMAFHLSKVINLFSYFNLCFWCPLHIYLCILLPTLCLVY